MDNPSIDALFTKLHHELEQCRIYRQYMPQYANMIYDIIIDDKYEPIWNNLVQYMYYIITTYITEYTKCMRALLHKYVINIDIIINNADIISVIFRTSDIDILKKYAIADQVRISKAILEQFNFRFMYMKLIKYILHTCDYTVLQWKRYCLRLEDSEYRLEPNAMIIKDYITKLMRYDESLRNTWIIACITI